MFKKTAFLTALLVAAAIKLNKKCRRLPLIGEKAPSFKANTTHGIVNFPEDYKGQWVILFSHPADFTPVCSSEFMIFQSMLEEFKKINTELIGLSVDSLSSHNAWIKTIKEKIEFDGLNNVEITLPVIDDLSRRVSELYGMIHPKADDTKTVRAVFIIDPKGIIRAILYYPLSNGRNIREIIRLVTAMQTTDEFKIATPANWTLGEDVILPPPTTAEGIQARLAEQSEDIRCYDWFMCFKKLPEDVIVERLIMKPDCLSEFKNE